MDYIKQIKDVKWFEVGRDFDYLRAVEGFKGLRLFPMEKTPALKVAIQQLMEGHDIPVVALVHAFDTEARIGDRPIIEEFREELALIKEKLNQGEALKKKLNDAGMSANERLALQLIFDDARNLISRVITRLEVMAAELIGTGQITIKENNIDKVIDFHVPAENRITITNWDDPDHSIISDLIAIRRKSKNKITRAFLSEKMMGYMLSNKELLGLAAGQNAYPTIDWIKDYLLSLVKIEFIEWDETYKLSALGNDEKRFFPEDTISFVTTRGALGKTFMTSTPAEDYGLVEQSTAFVTVHPESTKDPVGVWTIASGVGLPVIANPKGLYVAKHV